MSSQDIPVVIMCFVTIAVFAAHLILGISFGWVIVFAILTVLLVFG